MRQNRDILAEYPMQSELSSSPICSVYRSRDPRNGDELVVKIIAPQAGDEDATNKGRFLRFMKAVKNLDLPELPLLHDFGFTEGEGAFMVMEWVPGVGIGGLSGASPSRTVPLLVQTIDALTAMAGERVVHHSLSPSDILVVESGARERVRLVGFGTAAYHPKLKRESLNSPSAGSAGYLPPELRSLIDDPAAGTATDIYSLALIATEILGCEVYGAGVQNPAVMLPESIKSGLAAGPKIEETLAAALRMEASRRPSYGELKGALVALVGRVDGASPPPPEAARSSRESADQLGETMILETSESADQLSATVVLEIPDLPVAEPEGEVVTPPQPPPPPEAAATPPPIPPVAVPDRSAAAAPAAPAHDPNKTNPALEPEALEASTPTVENAASAPRTESPRPHSSRLVWVALLSVVGLVLVVVTGISIRILVRAKAPARVVPTPVVIRPTPMPTPAPSEESLHPVLEQADQLLLAGDLEAAQALVSSLSDEEKTAFTELERSVYEGIVSAAASSRLETAVRDLEGGLQHGSIRMIKRGVAGLENVDAAEWADRPELTERLNRARSVLRLHAQLWEAHEAENQAEVLELAQALIQALPKYSTPYDFREEAAAALEGESQHSLEQADFGRALSLLQAIRDHWPERPGLAAREARIETARTHFGSLQKAIASARSRAEAGQPEQGLAELAKIDPPASLRGSYAEAEKHLRDVLASLDAAAPVIEPVAGGELDFKKKEAAVLDFVITDDHRVRAVSAYVKTAAAESFTELALTHSENSDRYQLRVPPERHDGESFLLYLEAVDVSGHRGRLGSPEEPLEVQRKGFLKSIFTR